MLPEYKHVKHITAPSGLQERRQTILSQYHSSGDVESASSGSKKIEDRFVIKIFVKFDLLYLFYLSN